MTDLQRLAREAHGKFLSGARLSLNYEPEKYVFPFVIVGGRRIEFVDQINLWDPTSEACILYQKAIYSTDRLGTCEFGTYGAFSLSEMKKAVDFLRYPDLPPEIIAKNVESIVAGLTEKGVRLAHISVDWSKDLDKPTIKNLHKPKFEVRFGWHALTTINAFSDRYNNGHVDFDEGHVDVERAVLHLYRSYY